MTEGSGDNDDFIADPLIVLIVGLCLTALVIGILGIYTYMRINGIHRTERHIKEEADTKAKKAEAKAREEAQEKKLDRQKSRNGTKRKIPRSVRENGAEGLRRATDAERAEKPTRGANHVDVAIAMTDASLDVGITSPSDVTWL
ncbi:PREDICTED: uncharacterized protein LOC106817548 [Priapulus caudatus]|uniref:Uncharacterized protein LOC106817548 n=1 Tax=Priapulus caudatus TaxID=37621 RepID=A0ABM1EZT7_PRICU|nr:PREDICTED: uncharacterized protein LOC106817548 [Priapulus caudatus]